MAKFILTTESAEYTLSEKLIIVSLYLKFINKIKYCHLEDIYLDNKSPIRILPPLRPAVIARIEPS